MADVVGITLVKQFEYRGDTTEEYSNTYHLTGAIPADDAAWKTLADALIAQEKTCYRSATVIRAYGYSSDSDTATAVWSYDYLAHAASVAGTLAYTAGMILCPGDSACWVRWKTSRLNSRGKPIYLRKYFHPAFNTLALPDTVYTDQESALTAFGTKLWDGSFLDARTLRSQHSAETILSSLGGPWITTRTLKRRGKRP